MIDRNDRLPVTRQVKSLNVNRSSIYYMPKPITEADQQVVMRIDRLHGWAMDITYSLTAKGLYLFFCRDLLAYAQSTVLAFIRHNGCEFWHRRC